VDKEGGKTWEQRIATGECQHRAFLHQTSSKCTRVAGATNEEGVKVDGPQGKAQLGYERTERGRGRIHEKGSKRRNERSRRRQESEQGRRSRRSGEMLREGSGGGESGPGMTTVVSTNESENEIIVDTETMDL